MNKPTLVVNPVTDRVFGAFAETLIEHGVRTASELERRLRSEYPLASVHTRLLSGERHPIWYVYRDGRWVNPVTVGTRKGEQGRDVRSRR